MADANKQLGAQISQQGVGAISIEHEDSDSDHQAGPHIELDLTCGLVDLQDEAAVAAAECAGALQARAGPGKSDDTSASDTSGASEDGPHSSHSSDMRSGGEPLLRDSLIQSADSKSAAVHAPARSLAQQPSHLHSRKVPPSQCRASASIEML